MKALNQTHGAAFGIGITLALFSAEVFAAKGGAAYGADGFPATAFEYARMVEPELGIPPRIDLGEGVEIPLYVDGIQMRGDFKSCDNPSRLGRGETPESARRRQGVQETETADTNIHEG